MKKFINFIAIALLITVSISSCSNAVNESKSDSGVKKAHIQVRTDENGNTIEQRNIINRLKRDNEIGQVKHLYIISSFTGEVMEYSTVVGKVTSGNKRLSPKTVNNDIGLQSVGRRINDVTIAGTLMSSDEVLDDGGTYGESASYFFWFDAQDNYHQYFPSGGTYVHISERPLRIKKLSMTFEVDSK